MTMDKAKLEDLRKRVEEAVGADRELDALLSEGLGICPEGAFRPCAATDPGTFGTSAYDFWIGPRYTASLDLVLGLVGERLPGWAWVVQQAPGGCNARVQSMTGPQHANGSSATSPALALLSALLAALSALEVSHG